MFTLVRTLLFAHVSRRDLERLMNFYHKEGHCSLCCDVLFKYTFSAPKSGSFLFNYMLIRGYHVSSSMLGSGLSSGSLQDESKPCWGSSNFYFRWFRIRFSEYFSQLAYFDPQPKFGAEEMVFLFSLDGSARRH